MIRLGPKVALAQLGWLVLALLVGWALLGVLGRYTITLLLVVAGVTLLRVLWSRVVLTPQGLDSWFFGRKSVPWSRIGGVYEIKFLGERYLRVLDAPANRSFQLPAPRSFAGIGRQNLARDRQLIEQWWATYRDRPAPDRS